MKYTIKHKVSGEVIFEGDSLIKADLRGANLSWANLSEADLRGANLSWANLSEANLSEANLSEANLSWANLSWANLSWANLSGANLSEANLSWANLSEANLSWANLSEANLSWANLSWANIKNVRWPAPTMVLLASWGKLSDNLCLNLMRYDASNHPNPELFLIWKESDVCPYNSVKIERSANFQEDSNLITSKFLELPVKSAYELMQELLTECCKPE